MGRKSRSQILHDGCYGHVYSRALEHRRIFEGEKDFKMMLKMLGESKAKYGYRIHHYCLMNTHFHLLVSMECVDLFSSGMKELKRLYANWLHKERRRYGPIWWGRFGSQLIEDERYLLACGMYIEMNPVEAGMVKHAKDWKYSSAQHYFFGQKDPLVDTYQVPDRKEAQTLITKINLERGPVIGSELFKITAKEQVAMVGQN